MAESMESRRLEPRGNAALLRSSSASVTRDRLADQQPGVATHLSSVDVGYYEVETSAQPQPRAADARRRYTKFPG